MVLGVEGEHPRGPDYDVIDVAAPVTHRDPMEHSPVATKFGQPPAYLLFAIGTDAPSPFVSMNAKHPGDL